HQLRAHYFQSHKALHEPVPRLEHGAHAAGAQQLFHVVARVGGQSRGKLTRREGVRRSVARGFRYALSGERGSTGLAYQGREVVAGQTLEALTAGVALDDMTLDHGLLVGVELAEAEGRQLLRAGMFEFHGIHETTLLSAGEQPALPRVQTR